jgi:hypothetical protein
VSVHIRLINSGERKGRFPEAGETDKSLAAGGYDREMVVAQLAGLLSMAR